MAFQGGEFTEQAGLCDINCYVYCLANGNYIYSTAVNKANKQKIFIFYINKKKKTQKLFIKEPV